MMTINVSFSSMPLENYSKHEMKNYKLLGTTKTVPNPDGKKELTVLFEGWDEAIQKQLKSSKHNRHRKKGKSRIK